MEKIFTFTTSTYQGAKFNISKMPTPGKETAHGTNKISDCQAEIKNIAKMLPPERHQGCSKPASLWRVNPVIKNNISV